MSGDASSAASVCCAVFGSLKSTDETLFDATICACVETFRTSSSRNVARSYAANAAPAISSAKPLTSMFIHVSRHEIDRERLDRMASGSGHADVRDRARHSKQFRAHGQSCVPGRREIDLEPDTVTRG